MKLNSQLRSLIISIPLLIFCNPSISCSPAFPPIIDIAPDKVVFTAKYIGEVNSRKYSNGIRVKVIEIVFQNEKSLFIKKEYSVFSSGRVCDEEPGIRAKYKKGDIVAVIGKISDGKIFVDINEPLKKPTDSEREHIRKSDRIYDDFIGHYSLISDLMSNNDIEKKRKHIESEIARKGQLIKYNCSLIVNSYFEKYEFHSELLNKCRDSGGV